MYDRAQWVSPAIKTGWEWNKGETSQVTQCAISKYGFPRISTSVKPRWISPNSQNATFLRSFSLLSRVCTRLFWIFLFHISFPSRLCFQSREGKEISRAHFIALSWKRLDVHPHDLGEKVHFSRLRCIFHQYEENRAELWQQERERKKESQWTQFQAWQTDKMQSSRLEFTSTTLMVLENYVTKA